MAKVTVNPELIHLKGIRILKAHFEVGDSIRDLSTEIPRFSTGLKSEAGFNREERDMLFRLYVKLE